MSGRRIGASREHVAAASRIAHVVDRLEDMATEVDAILLARDDAETHAAFAAPFLDAGLPIYIDKPLALSIAEAEAMYAREKHEGQIFTCSRARLRSGIQPLAKRVRRSGACFAMLRR